MMSRRLELILSSSFFSAALSFSSLLTLDGIAGASLVITFWSAFSFLS